MANPKIQTRFIEILMEMMMKMRKYFIQFVVAIRCRVRAKEDLLVVVAMIPKHATRIVKRLIVLRSSVPIVSRCWPKPSDTR